MSDVLQQFEDDQEMLLMYLSGELSETDRAQVQARLVTDAALSAELVELESLHSGMVAAFAQGDAGVHFSRGDVAARAVSRAVVASVLQPAQPKAAKKSGLRRGIGWLAYPIAAAALAAIAVKIFPPTPGGHLELVNVPPANVVTPEIIATAPIDDSLATLESEVKEVALMRTPTSSFFASEDFDR